MNDQAVEQEIQANGLTAPRVTPADIEENIDEAIYINPGDHLRAGHPASLLTICLLVLKNGFTVTGESACASPENFDAELGRKIARQNAVDKVWPLMDYALKEREEAVPEGWLRAVDEALVCWHIGVASLSDTYEQAKDKLHKLICIEIQAATDPAVNGGWQLVAEGWIDKVIQDIAELSDRTSPDDQPELSQSLLNKDLEIANLKTELGLLRRALQRVTERAKNKNSKFD